MYKSSDMNNLVAQNLITPKTFRKKKYTLILTLLLTPLAVNFPLDATASGLRVTEISTRGQYPEVLGLI